MSVRDKAAMSGVVLVVTVMSIAVALIPLPAALLWVCTLDLHAPSIARVGCLSKMFFG